MCAFRHFWDKNIPKTEKLLTEIDEEPAVALALVLGKNHDAGNVVFLLAVLLLVKEGERESTQTLKNKRLSKMAETFFWASN